MKSKLTAVKLVWCICSSCQTINISDSQSSSEFNWQN